MNDTNPYSAPTAGLEKEHQTTYRLSGPRSVAMGRGWGWIADGFSFFAKSPLQWILAIIVLLVVTILLAFIPILGQLVSILTSFVWSGGLMMGCRAQDNGQPFELTHVFAGFRNPGKLVALSVLVAGIGIVVTLLALGPLYWDMLTSSGDLSPETIDAMSDPTTFWLRFLIAMLVFMPIIMAVWFSPALIALDDRDVFEAMTLSFKGCLKNILPMLLYGILALIFYIIAIIPLGLGLLVLGPVLVASVYVSYKDVFIDAT